MRRSLGAELLAALEEDEPVELVTQTSTWASPQTLLAVTDRRLLWLLDDAISHRVRSLAFKAITAVEVKRAQALDQRARVAPARAADRVRRAAGGDRVGDRPRAQSGIVTLMSSRTVSKPSSS